MDVRIEDVSSVKKRVQVTIPKERVEEGVRHELAKLQKTAKLKGFRPGKAPMQLVEKLYRGDAYRNFADNAVKISLAEIVRENDYDVASRPTVEKEEFPEGNFTYDAVIELHPDVKLGNYKGLTVCRKKVEVSGDELDERVEAMRQRFATYEDRAEGDAVVDGDLVRMDILSNKLGGQDVGTNEGQFVDLSRPTIYPAVREALVGARIGDERDVTIEYPDDVERPEMRGKKTEMRIRVMGIRKKLMPDLAETAAKMGLASADELTEKVRDEIVQGKTRQGEEQFRTDLFKLIADENPFDVPDGVREDVALRMMEEFVKNVQRSGVDIDKAGFDWKVMFENYKQNAESLLKRQYIVRALEKHEGLTVTDDELRERIMSMVAGVADPDNAAKYLDDENLRRNVAMEMKELKAVEYLVANNTVVEE